MDISNEVLAKKSVSRESKVNIDDVSSSEDSDSDNEDNDDDI